MEENKRVLITNDRGYCTVDDWCDYMGVDLNDTLRILKKNYGIVGSFGKKKIFLKEQLDQLLVKQVESVKTSIENRSKKLKNKSDSKKVNNQLIQAFEVQGWTKETIAYTLNYLRNQTEGQELLKKIGIENVVSSESIDFSKFEVSQIQDIRKNLSILNEMIETFGNKQSVIKK